MNEKPYICPLCHKVWYYMIDDRDVKVYVPDCPKCQVELQREAAQ